MASARKGKGRLQVTLRSTTIDRIEEEAKKSEQTVSEYMQAVMNEYFKSYDTLAQMNNIPAILEQLKLLQEEAKEAK